MPALVSFALLGGVRITVDDRDVDPGSPQVSAMLALLLARAGRPATIEEIVEVLWEQDPPPQSVNIVYRHIGTLRRLIEPQLPVRANGHWLIRGNGGYRLAVDEGNFDLLRCRALAAQAARLDGHGAPGRRMEVLAEALAAWKGPAGAGLAAQVRLRPSFTAIDREYLELVRSAADAALAVGVFESVMPHLRRAVGDNPFDESLAARLMLALAATGQQAEALAVHQRIRDALAEELGVDPGADLQTAYQQVLRQELPRPEKSRQPDLGWSPTVPAQLPMDLVSFAGRDDEETAVLEALEGGARDGGGGLDTDKTAIVAISGMAGVGKTTLALRCAHRVARHFPDGQLYADLRGFDPAGPAATADVLSAFLQALGVPSRTIPDRTDEMAALFRSILDGRRVLVILDNARSADQVRPLLPGAADCRTVVTSRDDLVGLVATEGAHPIPLDPMASRAARRLLTRRLGSARVDAEPDAVDAIVEMCAGLPLALALAAARAATRRTFSLSAIAAELNDRRARLDALTSHDRAADVRTVFSWSYLALGSPAARVFRLFALHPGPTMSGRAVGRLADLTHLQVRPLVDELTRVGLLSEPAPSRYAMHDLLRAYALELLERHETTTERDLARRRLFGHYADLLAPFGFHASRGHGALRR